MEYAIVLFVIAATFRAWEDEYRARTNAEIELKKAIDARPALRLHFDPTNKAYVWRGGPTTRFYVGVVNDGPIRDEKVSVVIHCHSPALEPSIDGYALLSGDESDFPVSPSYGDTPSIVLVLVQHEPLPASARPDEVPWVRFNAASGFQVRVSEAIVGLRIEGSFQYPLLYLRLRFPRHEQASAEVVSEAAFKSFAASLVRQESQR